MQSGVNNGVLDGELMTDVLDMGFDYICDIAGLRCWNLVFVRKLESVLRSDMVDADVRSEYQSLLDFNKVMLTARFPVRLNGSDEVPTKYSPFSIFYRKWVTDNGEIKEYDEDNWAILNSIDTFDIKGDISISSSLSDFSVFMEKYFDELFDVFKQCAINMQHYNRCVYSDCLADINNIFYGKAEEIIFDERFARKHFGNNFSVLSVARKERSIDAT